MTTSLRGAIALMLGVLALAGVPACAQQANEMKFAAATDAIRQSQPVASRELTTLGKLASAGEYRAVGFRTADEATAAKLGDPFPLFRVGLDQLRSYQPGS